MSHFYASIKGNRGEATRGGTKESGMTGHIRGWNRGIRVEVDYNEERGDDVATIWITGGSNDSSGTLLCWVYEDGKICFADNRLNLIHKAQAKDAEFEEALRADGLIK